MFFCKSNELFIVVGAISHYSHNSKQNWSLSKWCMCESSLLIAGFWYRFYKTGLGRRSWFQVCSVMFGNMILIFLKKKKTERNVSDLKMKNSDASSLLSLSLSARCSSLIPTSYFMLCLACGQEEIIVNHRSFFLSASAGIPAGRTRESCSFIKHKHTGTKRFTYVHTRPQLV